MWQSECLIKSPKPTHRLQLSSTESRTTGCTAIKLYKTAKIRSNSIVHSFIILFIHSFEIVDRFSDLSLRFLPLIHCIHFPFIQSFTFKISILAMYTSITFLLAIVASVQAANNVAEKVTYTAAGASAVIGNHFGCAHSECFLLHLPTRQKI